MKEIFTRASEPARRHFMQGVAAASLGLSLPQMLQTDAQAASSGKSGNTIKPTADAVIQIVLGGGMSHVDTLDIKTHAKVSYGIKPIDTNVDGIQIGELMPKFAQQMDKATIIRSMTSKIGAHSPAMYYLRTSYKKVATIVHPKLGAWTSKFRPTDSQDLPTYINLGGGASGRGFLDSEYGALPLLDPNRGLPNSKRASHVSSSEYDHRLNDLNKLNQAFYGKYKKDAIKTNIGAYDKALSLMKSKDLDAFDINKEDKATLEAYGKDHFARSCLLARRLVEAGVRFIDISHGSWDHHTKLTDVITPKCQSLDHALATLLADLDKRGMLERTMVVVRTEFGRVPQQIGSGGRGHFPKAFSGIMAGGGMKAGHVHGETNEMGRDIVSGAVEHTDVAATIATALGMDTDQVIMSPNGRPFQIAHKGKPIKEIFA